MAGRSRGINRSGNAATTTAQSARGISVDLDQASGRLEGESPLDILAWAWETYGARCAMSSSFQTQSLPLLHMVSRAAPEMPILFLDTGYHFLETLAFRDRMASEWGLNVISLQGDKSQEYAETLGREPLHAAAPDRCCLINKVRPMSKALERYDAWVSGIRRDQTVDRKRFDVLEEAPGGKVRIHPMLSWNTLDVDRYIHEHGLPHHPLTDQGYDSIGCAPCTRKGSAREGRWPGQDKAECGLHTRRDDQQVNR